MSKAGERRRSSRRRICAREWIAYWNLGEITFHELSCLRVDSILASASTSIWSGRSLVITSPSTVGDLHPWPLQEAKERRIRR
ncbi:unnamed protein product [Victoria cruziana]